MGSFIGVGGGGSPAPSGPTVYDYAIDQYAFPQEYVLDAYTAYVVGDIIIVTSDPSAFSDGAAVASGSDTISGSASVTVPRGGSAIIQATGTSDFTLLASAPSLLTIVSGTGGSVTTLPQRSTIADLGIVRVDFDNFGTGDPVTIDAYAGDSIATDLTPEITNFTNHAYFVNDSGSWQYYINSNSAPQTLPEYAQTLSPAHVWFGRTDPYLDLVATAHFVNPTGAQQVAPIPVGAEGVLVSNPATTAVDQIASGTFPLHRNANRSFAWVFQAHADDTWTDCVLTTLGAFADDGGLCSFRTYSGNFVLDTCNWSGASGEVIETTANIIGKTVLVIGKYATSGTLLSIRVSIDGGAWIDKTLVNSDTKTSTSASWWLGFTNSGAGQITHSFAAFWNSWNAYNNADSFKSIIWP